VSETVQQGRHFVVFHGSAAHEAYSSAKRLMKRAGFSVGPTQRGAPTACMFGAYLVSKWRNLSRDERAGTHAVIEGDGLNGPVRIRLLPALTDEAFESLCAEASELSDLS